MRFWYVLPAIVTPLLSGCSTDPSPSISAPGEGRTSDAILSEPLDRGPLPSSDQAAKFVLLDAAETGIEFVHAFEPASEHADHLRSSFTGAGVVVADYDNDGRQDIYLLTQRGSPRLYRNLGQFRFEDVTEQAGILAENLWGTGATFADFDNDGDLDLYVCCCESPNRLYINQGDGTFVDTARASGIDYDGASIMLAVADYDGDGDLDAYLLTNRTLPKDFGAVEATAVYSVGRRKEMDEKYREYLDVINMPDGSHRVVNAGQYDHLYRNDGVADDGTIRFTDVSDEVGIRGNYYGLSATWWDYNHDGRPDLYVANDFYGPDHLYRNDGAGTDGVTRFTDVVAEALPHTPWYSMGADICDVNHDGRMDLMGSDMAGTNHYRDKMSMGQMSGPNSEAWFLNFPNPPQYMRNTVYLNTGTPRFMEVAHMCGLAKTDWTWTVRFADLDNDGHEDLFATNGMSRDWLNGDLIEQLRSQVTAEGTAARMAQQLEFWKQQPEFAQENLAFRNTGDLKFKPMHGAWGLNQLSVSYGAALGDLDDDGDLDLVVNNFCKPPSVYRNDVASGNCLRIALRGTQSNRMGLGTTLHLRADGTDQHIQTRYHTLSRGFMSASEPVVHFGIGDREVAERLEVTWPSGRVQEFSHLAANHLHLITEPEDSVPRSSGDPGAESPDLADRTTTYAEAAHLPLIKHRETVFDDYQRQPLLPNKNSQLGPGLAVADLNGDGFDDFFLAAAAGDSPRVYLRTEADAAPSWTLRPAMSLDFETETPQENLGAVFLDADADGDLDLYTTSGSVECEPGDAILSDRFYVNEPDSNGTPRFHLAPDAIPHLPISSGPLAAADFDRDGDVDLFVGGRIIPGSYPESPASVLLRNEFEPGRAPRFKDQTADVAAPLAKSGMVTAAVWSDADGDGWLDLLVAHEWGPIKLYRNLEGVLYDATAEAGLADRTGWYNSIAARDFDNDGDIDYVVGNMGLNTKYKASPASPQMLYYGDFGNTGKKHIVEAKFERQPGDQEICLPIRGLGCSSGAMPWIKDELPTFHEFASTSLGGIYGDDQLSQASRYEVNSLESGILFNDGNGRFDFVPLPRIAQAAPCFGIAVGDFNADGFADIYIVQNSFSPQPETGYMDGGVSLMLEGSVTESGHRMTPVWPDRSGLVVTGDAKAVAATDLNGDGWQDFLVTRNNGNLVVLTHRGEGEHQPCSIRLIGREGNPTAIGAQVRLEIEGKPPQLAEVHAGSGYLTQASSTLVFGIPRGSKPQRILVRWPDGTTSEHSFKRPDGAGQPISIRHP